MRYQTCVGCVHGKGACQERDRIKAAVTGLSITSMKFRCKHKRLEFRPGDPVLIRLIQSSVEDSYYGEGPSAADYKGHVVRNDGSKLLCFIEPQTVSECGEYQFEPKSNGFAKVPRSRVTRREGIREGVCKSCRRLISRGHESECWSVHSFNPNQKIEVAEE